MQTHDISDEVCRTYHYADGARFTIQSPRTLYLKQDERGDSHRVLTADGEVFYPRRGWIALSWRPADPGDPVKF